MRDEPRVALVLGTVWTRCQGSEQQTEGISDTRVKRMAVRDGCSCARVCVCVASLSRMRAAFDRASASRAPAHAREPPAVVVHGKWFEWRSRREEEEDEEESGWAGRCHQQACCSPTCSSRYSIPFHSITLHCTTIARPPAARIIPFYSIPLHSTPFHSVTVTVTVTVARPPAARIIPFHSIPLHSTPFHSIPLHSTPFHSIPFRYRHRCSPTCGSRSARYWPIR